MFDHDTLQWIWIFLCIPYPLELLCRLHTYALILRCSCDTDFLDYLLEKNTTGTQEQANTKIGK
jgi:hypothetical protein